MRGVLVSGADTSATIQGNIFRNLRYGIYATSSAVPTVSANTFESCVEDTFGF